MATAQIHLSSITHNLKQIRRHLKPETGMLVALKANAYGHGAVPVAKHLITQGINWFGVATEEEALELRMADIDANILILVPVYETIEELVSFDIALTVADEHSLEALKTLPASKKARVHLKVDTGMGRLGLGKEAIDLARKIDSSSFANLESIWTHFASSDDKDRTYTLMQLDIFQDILDSLAKDGIEPEHVHASNSAAIFAFPEAEFSMVRPGIAVYGYHSSTYIESLEPNLKPALTLTAPITFIKQIKAGTSVSYSNLWKAPQDTTLATVRIGYADGYPRLLTGKAEVLVQDQLRPLAGRICMDQLMVDVGGLEVSLGEEVTLFGPGKLDAEKLAARMGTISYELLVALAQRVRRIYVE